MKRYLLAGLLVLGLFACTRLFPDKAPLAKAPSDVKRVSFEIVARDDACSPSVIAVDRERRSILIALTFRSEGKKHVIAIPDWGVRKYLDPGQEATVEFLAERSGIYEFGCGSFPFLTPFSWKGKIAVK
ncbi:MAG: cupredoxin domain-containing protein [Candidatus Methylomirabilales bacterium]